MDNPGIDDTQTRAICDEIGERLRILLKPRFAGETPDLFEDRLDQLFLQQTESAPNP
jgi:hypothetical protein